MIAKRKTATGPKKSTHTVVMRRPDGWYSADNEMIDMAAEIGINAFGVYHLLKSRLWRADPQLGVRDIAAKLGIGKDAAAIALRRLKLAGLARELPRKGVNSPARYELEHAKDVLQARMQSAFPCPSNQTQDVDARVPQTRHRGKKSVSLKPDTAVPETRHRCLSTRTPNKEEGIRNKDKYYPLTPASGGMESPAPQAAKPQRERRETAAERQQRERASVGSIAVVPNRVRGENLSSAEVRDGVRVALAQVREDLEKLLNASKLGGIVGEDFVAEWDGAFGGVEYESHEAFEGSAGGLMVRVSSPQPRVTVKALDKYAHRIQARLAVTIGGRVALQVMSREEAAA
jgi:hypothetical protein